MAKFLTTIDIAAQLQTLITEADGFLFSIDKTYLDNTGKVKSAYRYLQNDDGKLECLEVDDGRDDN
jgi:hypothetical protein